MNTSENNLVLGLCSGYKFIQLKPLINSLKQTGFSGKIVLFVNKINLKTKIKLESEGINLIQYNNVFPYFEKETELFKYLPSNLKGKELSPNSLRYVLYRAFLKANIGKFKWILHTDTRDVYFQSNPFKYYSKDGVYCFLEDSDFSIKDNIYNSYWIKFGFGDEVYSKMADLPICCSGVTLGSFSAFLNYLDLMVDYIVKLPNAPGLDQGIHNFLIYKNKITDVYIVMDDEGLVSTVSSFKPGSKLKFNSESKLVNHKGEVVSIIHQYDRQMFLLWRYNKPEFFVRLKNLFKRKILISLGRKELD